MLPDGQYITRARQSMAGGPGTGEAVDRLYIKTVLPGI